MLWITKRGVLTSQARSSFHTGKAPGDTFLCQTASREAPYHRKRTGLVRRTIYIRSDRRGKIRKTGISYCVATTEDLVVHKNGMKYDREEFLQWPAHYASDFKKWAASTDILLSCHFWDSNAPVYLDYEDLSNAENRIRVIGDVTCDINGSIKSTVRPSTHSNPFYDYNPMSRKEELPFSSNNNISVMAVDTCPNALAMDASTSFGEMLIQNVIFPILEGHISDDPVIRRATILDRGQLTPAYKYLDTFL